MTKKNNLLSRGIIAESNKQIDKENEERKAKGLKERKKFGEYTESTGGGTPIPKGKTKEDMEGKPGFHRVSQPRDDEGKFTYNAANGKGLKYGPSRGETIPPFLRGVVLTCIEEGTTMKTENMERILSTLNMTAEQIFENCKHYLESEEGFAGLIGGFVRKKGRESKAEKGNVGITGKQDLSKAGETTKNSLAQAKAEYDKAEKSKRAPEPGLNSSPSQYYNKAGVTQEGLEKREAWRDSLKKSKLSKLFESLKTSKGESSETKEQKISVSPKIGESVKTDSKVETKKGAFDSGLASSKPEQFLKDNFDEINEIYDLLGGEESGVEIEDIVSLIASGQLESLEQAKKLAQETDEEDEEEEKEAMKLLNVK